MTRQLLVDTHVLLWWLTEPDRITPAARTVLADPDASVWVSAASLWEIATKVRLGRLSQAVAIVHSLPELALAEGFDLLSVSASHAIRAGLLPGSHRDPFDRMIAAQAQAENLVLVSRDPAFDAWHPVRVW